MAAGWKCRPRDRRFGSIQRPDGASTKGFSNGLRCRRHRNRAGRICLRDQGGAARPEDGRGGKARHAGRHLRQCRLHPLQGAAACLGDVRGGRPRFRSARRRTRRAEAQSEEDAGAQGSDGRAERQGPRLPDEEEQDRCAQGDRQDRCRRQGSGDRRRRRGARDRDHATSSSRPARTSPASPAWRSSSTRRSSCPRPALCRWKRCRVSWSWSAAA